MTALEVSFSWKVPAILSKLTLPVEGRWRHLSSVASELRSLFVAFNFHFSLPSGRGQPQTDV
jgi:hypothetical protein